MNSGSPPRRRGSRQPAHGPAEKDAQNNARTHLGRQAAARCGLRGCEGGRALAALAATEGTPSLHQGRMCGAIHTRGDTRADPQPVPSPPPSRPHTLAGPRLACASKRRRMHHILKVILARVAFYIHTARAHSARYRRGRVCVYTPGVRVCSWDARAAARAANRRAQAGAQLKQGGMAGARLPAQRVRRVRRWAFVLRRSAAT